MKKKNNKIKKEASPKENHHQPLIAEGLLIIKDEKTYKNTKRNMKLNWWYYCTPLCKFPFILGEWKYRDLKRAVTFSKLWQQKETSDS